MDLNKFLIFITSTTLIVLVGFSNPLWAQGETGEEQRSSDPQPEPETPTDLEETSNDPEANSNDLEATSKMGSVRLGLLLQPGMDIFPNQLEDRRFGFSLQRTRLALSGHVVLEDLTYLLSGDAATGALTPDVLGYPGSEIFPESGNPAVPFLLDARINWNIRKMGIRLSVGRFIPKWGLSMPGEILEMPAISYPLYVFGGLGSLGIFRSIGVEAEVTITDYLDIGGGVFNGGRNTWLDDNNRKDILLFVSTDFLPGLRIRASTLFAFPEKQLPDPTKVDPADTSPPPTRTETHIRSILEARYTDLGFDAMAGIAHGAVTREIAGSQADYSAFGFMFHLGYLVVGDWFQIMGRFERWEPSTEENRLEQIRITIGPQLRIHERNLHININYIQDFFASAAAMCQNHLGPSHCQETDLPSEARKEAATILAQITLAL